MTNLCVGDSLRIGDFERDAAAESLSAHYAAGRLDRVEFDERLAAAYAAKTGAELTPLLSDLPGAQIATVEPRRSPDWRGPSFHPALLLLGFFLAASTVGAIVHGYPPVFLFLTAFWIVRSRRRHSWR